jgi:Cytochrome bd terminal oxidase subunit I
MAHYMELTALLLSRIQFAFTIAYHIVFPTLNIGLALFLLVLEATEAAPVQSALEDIDGGGNIERGMLTIIDLAQLPG